jgi:hypothetical protein
MRERMKVAYIAGPYRAATTAGIQWNILRARNYAEKYWKLGCMAYCPHLNSQNMDGLVPDEVFLRGGLEMLRRCDAIVMVPGWENSTGAKAELAEAVRLGLEVIMEVADANQI